ncbi:germ cell nuclear acidic protein-like [Achroia grisella]|uniref:germ cell nuclear acidic protein-like n=1 Tax=Achroia grisella TaxID=688607 RepID=UPI0027D31BD3|nr:germ cell nuclear acidic protein-like [Achroia grisella]
MERKNVRNNQKNRFLKLSLKKNRLKIDQEMKLNRSSDVIILDESFDRLKLDLHNNVQRTPIIYSPIVINDSCESTNESLPKIITSDNQDGTPSKNGNVSFNCSKEDTSLSKTKDARPSIGGWSPAQNIISASPRYETVPSTPHDIANESLEQCSIKKIQQSQKKLLDDLYGETWKSIPKLFKTISHNYPKMNGISKKLQYDDDDSDKENIRNDLEKNRQLYLTGSDVKRKVMNYGDTEKKSKKKLYTEKVPDTPDIPRTKVVRPRNVNSTTKKTKAMSVTELVEIMRKGDVDKNDVSLLTKKVEDISVTPKIFMKKIDNVSATPHTEVKRLSFVGSLADNVPTWRCHPEAFQYKDNYKTMREQLATRLYIEFNKVVFDNTLEEDLPILWDSKLRSTAGTTTNRLLKNSKGDRRRTSSVKLSTKVLDTPQRLRDTLIHELCHAATWLIDGELRAGHGPLWKKWATHALRKFPELGEISRCHDMQIHYKYSYKCTKCGYNIQRHSKSIDITKKCCGYCRGSFELIINKKKKDGVVVSTPARKGGANDFALYVKENYGQVKDSTRSHGEVMKLLGEQFSAKKKLNI